MPAISLEHQKQLGRHLGRLRKNAPEAATSDESAGDSGQMSAVGTAGFIMLGGFALLKDIFDFVFVGMAFFVSKLTVASTAIDIGSIIAGIILWLFPEPIITKWGGTALTAAGIASLIASIGGAISEGITQANGIILPFLFSTMFMIVVVAVLLLSGMGLKSYKIFLSTRFIVTSFFGFFAEIIPGLNVLPWTAIYVIFLYFFVKREIKKQQEKTQTA